MAKERKTFTVKQIGVIHTPYKSSLCPVQPVEREEGESRIVLYPEYRDALKDLSSFKYIYVMFYCDRIEDGDFSTEASPPWAKGRKVGLFAARSPRRPNPIGISIVELRKIEDGELVTGLLDAWDSTPLLDIKPYIKSLDSKDGANNGWISELKDHEHLLEHVRGIKHEHHHHDHDHKHDHGHHHDHHHDHDHNHDD